MHPFSMAISTSSAPDSRPRCTRVRPASASSARSSGARRASVLARPYVVTRSTDGKRSRTRRMIAASFWGLTAHGSASCRNTVRAPSPRNSDTWYASEGTSPSCTAATPRRRSTSAASAIASTSASTSSTGRSDDFVPLYTGQNVQRFQVQLRIVRTRRLCASLGGLMGPCSKEGVVISASVDLQPAKDHADQVHEDHGGHADTQDHQPLRALRSRSCRTPRS